MPHCLNAILNSNHSLIATVFHLTTFSYGILVPSMTLSCACMCVFVELKSFKFRKIVDKTMSLYSMITIIIIIINDNFCSFSFPIRFFIDNEPISPSICLLCSMFVRCWWLLFYKIKVKSKLLACKSSENLFKALWVKPFDYFTFRVFIYFIS